MINQATDYLTNKLKFVLKLSNLEIKKVTKFWHNTLNDSASLYALLRGFTPTTDYNILKKPNHSLIVCKSVFQYEIYALQKFFRKGLWNSRNERYRDWILRTKECSYRNYCKDKRKFSDTYIHRPVVAPTGRMRIPKESSSNCNVDHEPKRDFRGRIILNKKEKRKWVNEISSRTIKNNIVGDKLDHMGNLWLYKKYINKDILD